MKKRAVESPAAIKRWSLKLEAVLIANFAQQRKQAEICRGQSKSINSSKQQRFKRKKFKN